MTDIIDAIKNGNKFASEISKSKVVSPSVKMGRCDSCGKYVPDSELERVQVETPTGRSGDSTTFVGDVFSYGKKGGKRGGVRYNMGRTYYKISFENRCASCRHVTFKTWCFILFVVFCVYCYFTGDSNEQAKRLSEPSKQPSSTGLPVERRQEESYQEKSLVASREFQQQVPGQEKSRGLINEEDRIRAILENKIEE